MDGDSGRGLIIELYSKMKSQGLRPSVIVDYTRTPFVYKPGNVRVTIDENIRTGLKCVDFLNPNCVTIPAGDPAMILEVKWDEYLPSVIRRAVQLKGRRCGAFSKYERCRIYGVRVRETIRRASGGQGDTLGLSAPNPDQRFHLWIPARNGSVNANASSAASLAGLRRWERQPLSACSQGTFSYS